MFTRKKNPLKKIRYKKCDIKDGEISCQYRKNMFWLAGRHEQITQFWEIAADTGYFLESCQDISKKLEPLAFG